MEKEILKQLQKIFELYPQIKLVYLFGSRAKKEEGPLSDYDFAIYLDEREIKKSFAVKLDLQDKISRLLKTDKVDVVIIDSSESPELKYNIIKDGELIFEKEPFRVMVEPKILNEYFDFMIMLRKYNLTKA